jgi:DNA-binding NarL/FixJ family response regulator
MAEGMSYRAAGDALGIAACTVKSHVHAIAEKLPNPTHIPAKTLVLIAWKKIA